MRAGPDTPTRIRKMTNAVCPAQTGTASELMWGCGAKALEPPRLKGVPGPLLYR